MTNEEAAKILDPETTLEAYAEREYYGGFNGSLKWREDVNEACKMGAIALRAQEKEPCEICSGNGLPCDNDCDGWLDDLNEEDEDDE